MMLECKEGTVCLSGKLDFSSVEALLPEGCRLIATGQVSVFDLREVAQSDSAGLALLLAWWRFALKHAATIRFTHVPETLKALMAVTNIDAVLADCVQ